jgi:pyruvate formate lyase activating enzyme
VFTTNTNALIPINTPRLLQTKTKAYIHSVENGGFVDGPGLRFVIFLAGCQLRCQYCHNPDTWHFSNGTLTESSDLIANIKRSAPFLRMCKGGVTFSGGEPLLQPEFLDEMLFACKELDLHTAIDTAGHVGNALNKRIPNSLLDNCDLFLLDIKAKNTHTYKKITSQEASPALQFAERLALRGRPVYLRYVLVPGLTDQVQSISELAAYAQSLGNIQLVEIIPFHQMGRYKWKNTSLSYQLDGVESPNDQQIQEAANVFARAGLQVRQA